MKNSPNTECNTEKDMKKILSRMTPLERDLLGRAGQWILKNGRHFDPELSRYICRCVNCKHYFTSKRPDAKTCGDRCKKARQRANLTHAKTAQMNLPKS